MSKKFNAVFLVICLVAYVALHIATLGQFPNDNEELAEDTDNL